MTESKIQGIKDKKVLKDKIVMLTAYDYPLAEILDKASIDIILVGDSLANVALGLGSTKEVGMDEMVHHAKAVRRAVKNALLVGDMPYMSYQLNSKEAVNNAKRFADEASCDAVKLEWFDKCLAVAEKIVSSGIPVMGHVGLTPQTADSFKVQGKKAKAAKEIIEQAKHLQKAGCFAVVLECIPYELSKIITEELLIPTIGIGAGKYCDGQVLVSQDLLGFFDRTNPKFVKQYVNLNLLASEAIKQFKREVKENIFPDEDHSYKMSSSEAKILGVKLAK
ncbi:MAG: 3-methyl-2-oxobutanoate hydroxymethyltransferase [Candidatus Omnitrophica bacterium]|nr:3-methyl-2-oxobutanoate hydroxymethyltransferase [Candidatus Omnitrophota bacterium]